MALRKNDCFTQIHLYMKRFHLSLKPILVKKNVFKLFNTPAMKCLHRLHSKLSKDRWQVKIGEIFVLHKLCALLNLLCMGQIK